MKKNNLLLLFMLWAAVSNAQIYKGTGLLGGRLGNLTFDAKSNNLNLNLEANYGSFLSKHFLIGAAVGIGFVSQRNSGNFSVLNVGPFLREYITNTAAGGAFLEQNVSISLMNISSTSLTSATVQF